MKTQVTAGWGNLVFLFHLCIINHLTQDFLGCINTAQDCSTGQREWIVFYFNERSRLLVTSLWRPQSDLTFLRPSTSYDQRWDVGRGKVWWTGSWQPVHLWNQSVTSWMTWSSSPLRVSQSSDVSTWRNVCLFYFYILSTGVFLAAVDAQQMFAQQLKQEVGPEPTQCVFRGMWPQKGELKERFFQSAEFINAACSSPFLKILHVTLNILEAPRSLAVKKALVLLNLEFPKCILSKNTLFLQLYLA